MRSHRLAVAFVLASLLAAAAPAQARHSTVDAAPSEGPELRTSRYLNAVRYDRARLREFLAQLPKGADLHNHLSGAVPTETLIALAVKDHLCIDTALSRAQAAPARRGDRCPAGQRPAADTRGDRDFYTQLLRAWSMQDFTPGAQSGHDHFFATFGKFSRATARKGDMLAAVAQVNARQRVHYLETLVSRQGTALEQAVDGVAYDPDLGALRRRLFTRGFSQIVTAASKETDEDIGRYRRLLRCGTPQADAGCRVTLRFDYQVGRAAPDVMVFAGLLLGFELQRRDPRYVGVNLVQPEDNRAALDGYARQMQMIRFLRSIYPGAHVTLHAGELVPGLAGVTPSDLAFHVRDAVLVAGSDRIGHGVDILGERDSGALLKEMARRHVLVEVPLSSNEQILGVRGRAHPFPRLLAAGVPVALATDDPGVSRIDITHEYEVATRRYGLSYRTLKRLSRASLQHSFLPGSSLWRGRDDYRLKAACAHDRPGDPSPSARCRRIVRASAKATAQWRLERALRAFERRARAAPPRPRR